MRASCTYKKEDDGMKEEILLEAATNEEKYDRVAKEMLKNPKLLAPILKFAVREYGDMEPEEIAGLFTDISDAVPVDPVSAKAAFLDTELSSVSEKLIRYDIHLKAAKPQEDPAGVTVYLFIDLEVQNKYTEGELGYPFLKRAVYYVARELSGQLGILTDSTNYGALQKSYSIWICNSVPAELENTATRFRIVKEDVIGRTPDEPGDYDLMEVVVIRRGRDGGPDGILDYLQGFFTSDADRIDRHVRIKADTEIMKEVDVMGGLGILIAEKNMAEGVEKGMAKGMAEGVTKGRKEERENNIETVTRNIMKRNPGMSYEKAREDAEALFA